MIYVIEDDEIMAECIARGCGGGVGGADGGDAGGAEHEVRIFGDAIAAMQALAEVGVPDLIFLDVLLTGPDGFTFLNELMSYADTIKVPVVVVTSLELKQYDLSAYGVVEVLDKSVMRPEDIRRCVREYA